MAYEIYYTSAPEGTRPGQSGFCTVATSVGIPKPLWDRLELISGYRHQFSGPEGVSKNPTSWAHWLVQYQGKDISVLSRLCDSGLDYTQRTNFFAHHVALEPAERAAAGPAWMLTQSRVMVDSWNGVVGNINRSSPLPGGDVRPAVCSNWQRLAGDAGWAGVLAESAMKQPRRPVAIIFTPEQQMLPLIAEAIALLPASRRWDVTFNTYFTGLPGNAVCSWRCCLAGTPAAGEAARHAAGGLIIDLAHPERLGKPPSSEWVEMARTGRASAATSASTPAAPLRLRKPPTTPAATTRKPFTVDRSSSEPEVSEEVLFENIEPEPAPAQGAQLVGLSRGVDTSWVERRARNRRRLLVASAALAFVFIGFGVWLRMSAREASTDVPLPPPTQPVVDDIPKMPVLEMPATTAPVEPVWVKPPPVVVKEVVKPVTQVVATQQVVRLSDPAPMEIVLDYHSLLPPPPSGAGLTRPALVFPLAGNKVRDAKAIRAFQLTLKPVQQTEPAGEPFIVTTTPLRVAMKWRDPISRAETALATIEFEPPKPAEDPRIVLKWETLVQTQRPQLVTFARALLQHAEMSVNNGKVAQKIRFQEAPVTKVEIDQPTCRINLKPLPGGLVLRTAKELPNNWLMTWKPTEDTNSTAGGTADAGVISFEHPPSAARFALRVHGQWNVLTSDWAEQLKPFTVAKFQAKAELDKQDEEIKTLLSREQSILEPFDKGVIEARDAFKKMPKKDTPAHALAKLRVDNAEASRKGVKDEADKGIKAQEAIRDAAAESYKKADAAAAVFDDLKGVEILVEIPDKLRVATLELTLGKH